MIGLGQDVVAVGPGVRGKPAQSWLFRRGDFHDHSIPVELGFVTVLTRGKSAADYWKEARAGDRTDTTYRRRARCVRET